MVVAFFAFPRRLAGFLNCEVVIFFVEAGLLLARLDFNIGFEMMIAYLFQTDCGGRAAKNRKFLSQLAFF
jgi:hypothetical protein